MSLGMESFAALSGLVETAPTAGPVGSSAPAPGFAQIFSRGFTELQAHAASAETAMRDLAAGKPVELHDVMIALEKARIGVQTFVQVRNRLMESYQDLLRMQL